MHADHATIYIEGRSPTSSHNCVHFEHCIPNEVTCNVLGWTLHIMGYGTTFDITHNAYVAPWKEWCIVDGTCGDMCPTQPPPHMGWSKLGKWCHHMWRLESLTKNAHLGHVWVGLDLYSHFNCGWLGQFMLLFPLPYLGRSSWSNSLTLGQDVRPCVPKAQSSWKSTPICRSSYLNWTSLDVAAQMQAAFEL